MTEILWRDEVLAVEVNGTRYEWERPLYGDLKAYEYSLDRSVLIYSMLESARDSY